MSVVADCRALRDPVPTPPAVARTYRGDRDGWERVLEYQRVADYCADHPEKGSAAVATALELPRGRIRAWVDDGGAPDPVHGLRTALDRNWFVEESDRVGRIALAVAVTWIAAGGSIAEQQFVPRFSAQTDAERARLERVADDLQIELEWSDRESRGVEASPSTDASEFGRVLLAAGAPTGPNETLPQWILEAPHDLRRAAAATYVECRGHLAGEGQVLQIQEEPAGLDRLEFIGDLLGGVAGAGSWTVGSGHVRLDRDATDALLEQTDVDLERPETG